MAHPLQAAVIGARGIGKHHAKWYAHAGCQVTSIYATQSDTAAATKEALADLFGYQGRAYADWREFLSSGDFQLCSVCSPAERHFQNVLDLLAAGKHVLCEKPLVWYWDQPADLILAQSREMVQQAEAAGLILAVNAQYPAGLPAFEALHLAATGEPPCWDTFRWEMETKGKPRHTPGPEEAWIDLGPHPLTLLEALRPEGQVDWDTLRHADGPTETHVEFDWVAGDGRRTAASLECRRIPGGSPKRCFGTRDFLVDYSGRNEDGVFCAVLSRDGKEEVLPDFMRISVERFVEAVRTNDPSRVLVSGAAGGRQAEALVGIWSRCWGDG